MGGTSAIQQEVEGYGGMNCASVWTALTVAAGLWCAPRRGGAACVYLDGLLTIPTWPSISSGT
jgi:hypothetical protein